MNTHRPRRHASDRDLFELAEGELPLERSKSLWEHLSQCLECRQRFTQWSDAQRMVTELPVTDAPSRVMARVRERLRESVPPRVPVSVRWAPRRWVPAAAAAAALLLAVFGSLHYWQRVHLATDSRARIARFEVDSGAAPQPADRPGPSADWGSVTATGSARTMSREAGLATAPPTLGPVRPPADRHDGDVVAPPIPEGPRPESPGAGLPVVKREFVAHTGPTDGAPAAGRPLGPGETLRTGDTDRAFIELPDGGQMVVGFDTEIEVAKAASLGGDGGFSVELARGDVWAWSPGDGGKISVLTPKGASRIHHGTAIVRLHPAKEFPQARGKAPLEVVAFGGQVEFADTKRRVTTLRPGQVLLADKEPWSLHLEPKAFERVIEVAGGRGKRTDAWQVWPLSGADLLSQLEAPRLPLGAKLELGPEEAPGLQVASVVPGSNAEQAGIQAGDAVVRMGDLRISTVRDLAAGELRLAQQEQGPRITLRREGLELSLELADRITEPSLCQRADEGLEKVALHASDDDIGGAVDTCLRLVSEQPACAAHWYNLGLLREYQGRFGDALAAYKKAEGIEPESPLVLTALARVYARIGNLTRARTKALKADAIQPLGTTRYLLGRIGVLDTNLAEMEQWSNMLLGSHTDEDKAWGELLAGQLAYIRSDHAGARRSFENALSLDPANFRATYYQAVASRELGDIAGAERRLERLVQVWRDSVAALNLMADLASKRGDWERARSWLERTFALQPDSAVLLCNRGLISLKEDDPEQAIRFYEEAIQADPSLIPAHTGLGDAALEAGRSGLAAKHYEEALRLNPSSQRLLDKLVVIYEQRGEPDQVERVRRRYDLCWAVPR